MKQVYHRKFDAVSTEDKLREDILHDVITALTYGCTYAEHWFNLDGGSTHKKTKRPDLNNMGLKW